MAIIPLAVRRIPAAQHQAPSGCYAEARGTTARPTAEWRIAAAASRTTAALVLGSALPGHLKKCFFLEIQKDRLVTGNIIKPAFNTHICQKNQRIYRRILYTTTSLCH